MNGSNFPPTVISYQSSAVPAPELQLLALLRDLDQTLDAINETLDKVLQ